MQEPDERAELPGDPGDRDHAPIRIKLADRRDLEARFANYVEATFAGETFVIRFGQFDPPTVSDEREMRAILEAGSIDAPVIAKFVLPASQFVEMANSFSALIQRLRQKGVLTEPATTEEGREIGG